MIITTLKGLGGNMQQWGVFLFSFLFLLTHPFYTSADQAAIVRKAQKKTVLSGYTRSETQMTVSSEVSGRVIRVNYHVGEEIGKKPFYEIDPAFINFEIERTAHSLEKLDIGLKKAESNVAYLNKEFLRIDALRKGDLATEAGRDAAKQSLDQAIFELESIKTERAALKTAMDELEERRKRHAIHAPEGWIVVRKMVEEGEVIGSGSPLAGVADFRTLVVPLSVSDVEYEAVKSLPEPFPCRLGSQTAKAAIHRVNPEFNEQTRKISIELVLSDYSANMRGGLKFTLSLEIDVEGLLIPRSAVTSRYENPRVALKSGGETINVMVLGEKDGNLIVAENPKLKIGTELVSESGNSAAD